MAFLLAAVVFLSFVAFLARTKSAPHRARVNARVTQAGESLLLSTSLMEYGLWLAGPFARVATRLRLNPDLFSWASLLFHFVAAAVLAAGRFTPAVWLLLIGGACDSLDGTVARARGLSSDAGEVLDAVIDRWSEMAVFFGLAYHYRDSDLGLALSLLSAAASVMVSYTRAKAQAMGVESAGGFMQRHERAAYLILAVLVSALLQSWNRPHADWPVLAGLGLIGVLATIASVQRTIKMRSALRQRAG